LSSPTSKQLQNDIVDLFRSQQKSPTPANRKTQYIFSSPDALMVNPHADAHNIKNTINLRNANSQQKEQTRAIVESKGMKKRKAMESPQKKASIEAGNEIYLYEVLATNLLQAMLVRRAEQSHRQSSNSAVRACYAHIHRSSIALRCSQTTRPHGQMIMWPNSERKSTTKWSAFTIHRPSIASRCSQTTQSPPSLLN